MTLVQGYHLIMSTNPTYLIINQSCTSIIIVDNDDGSNATMMPSIDRLISELLYKITIHIKPNEPNICLIHIYHPHSSCPRQLNLPSFSLYSSIVWSIVHSLPVSVAHISFLQFSCNRSIIIIYAKHCIFSCHSFFL